MLQWNKLSRHSAQNTIYKNWYRCFAILQDWWSLFSSNLPLKVKDKKGVPRYKLPHNQTAFVTCTRHKQGSNSTCISPLRSTPFSSRSRPSSWRHDAIPLPGVCCNAVNGDQRCEGGSGRRIHKLGRRQRGTRNTVEKWWGTVWVYMQGERREGKFSSHCARAWALTLTPEEYPRLRIRAAPGFSVLVLGFQPRLLGDRTMTSRTDVTTVHHRTRYPGPIVDPRIGLRSPSASGVHSYLDCWFRKSPTSVMSKR